MLQENRCFWPVKPGIRGRKLCKSFIGSQKRNQKSRQDEKQKRQHGSCAYLSPGFQLSCFSYAVLHFTISGSQFRFNLKRDSNFCRSYPN